VTKGFAVRLRRLAGANLQPGLTVDGRVVVEAGIGHEIDNMEGLAVSTDETGETILTLASDDNGIVLQRTLILRFALLAPAPPLPPVRPQAAAAATVAQ
jgi:hypothetical protein